MTKLTKKLMQEYGIEIESQIIDSLALPRPITFYTVVCDGLKVNWSGTGNAWLRKSKRDLLAIIES